MTESPPDVHGVASCVSDMCVRFTGADMALLVKRASLICLQENEDREENENKENEDEERDSLDVENEERSINEKEKEKEKDENCNQIESDGRVKENFILQDSLPTYVSSSVFGLSEEHFKEALALITPSVFQWEIDEYDDWSKKRK